MGLSLNGSCHFCKENETLLHLFVHYRFVDSLWIEVFGKKEMLLNIRKRL
jgi:hypothetical protein